jgi:hypothetical protein
MRKRPGGREPVADIVGVEVPLVDSLSQARPPWMLLGSSSWRAFQRVLHPTVQNETQWLKAGLAKNVAQALVWVSQ